MGSRVSPAEPGGAVTLGIVGEAAVPEYWNHNVHYQPVILAAVPPACGAALDVGCGDGLLARRLAARCGTVTGIDRDPGMIRIAREQSQALPNVSFIEGDFLAEPFGKESFDLLCSVTALHHMDFGAALTRKERLLRPGGMLAIVGLARDGSLGGRLAGAAGLPADWVLRAVHGQGSSGAPIADPQMTWRQVREAARELLPGARYRRHLLWRYSLLWRKPR